MSKDSLVKGTLILTVAALIARFLGVFQRFPLVYMLGNEGMASYAIAFNLYSNLLVIATAGIPSALSKMISERTALGRMDEANRIYKAALIFAALAGVVMCAVLFLLAPHYAQSSGDPHATLATLAIAPALLVFPLIAIMRGYFQGRQRMMPNGISQVIEQIVRLITAVGLAYLLLGVSLDWAVAGASFGGVTGGIAALAVMLYYALKLRKEDRGTLPVSEPVYTETDQSRQSGGKLRYGQIYGQLLRLSIPIVIFSITVTLIYNIDSSTIIPLLRDQIGEAKAKDIVGILGGQAQSLAGLPIVLAIALSQSVVPIISGAYSRRDLELVRNQSSRVMQLAILSGLPMVLAICTAARPLSGMFDYGGTPTGYEYGPPMIAMMTAGAMFQIIMQTSGAVLMGMGKMRALVSSVVFGIAVKLLGNLILSPWLGIYGILASTMLCFIVMSAFNLAVMRNVVSFRIMAPRRWTRLIVTTAVVVVIGVFAERLLFEHLHLFPWRVVNATVNAVLIGALACVLYVILLFVTKVVTKNDIKTFPAPLQKLYAKAGRVLGRRG
ncbi:stage V sporulation protein B [Paenibacillus chitinolyticus]|uniref:putative polysaccharide biosynthesis protein n=1 Tax=Paenibacillus chitinolyticus TaxID=79263 RepID=UPI0026E4DCC7|nr:polysaccharide biosynthesis protein [Paenibacillus chitinolyticus]GKS13679.1 stage V sporulation protein B [Paenibacillus chitinolyticus]